MDIKGPRSGQPVSGPSPASPDQTAAPARNAARTFPAGDAAATSPSGLEQVLAGFTKGDLENSVKRDQMMRTSIGELIRRQSDTMGALPEAKQQQIADWMMNDPVTSNRLRRLLESVLP